MKNTKKVTLTLEIPQLKEENIFEQIHEIEKINAIELSNTYKQNEKCNEEFETIFVKLIGGLNKKLKTLDLQFGEAIRRDNVNGLRIISAFMENSNVSNKNFRFFHLRLKPKTLGVNDDFKYTTCGGEYEIRIASSDSIRPVNSEFRTIKPEEIEAALLTSIKSARGL